VLTWVFCDLLHPMMQLGWENVISKFELAESPRILRYFFVFIAKPKGKNYNKLNWPLLNSFL
jgi:hypothetical protein